MKTDFPLIDHAHFEQSVALIEPFLTKLKLLKQFPPEPGYAWYPYDTLSSWWIFRSLWDRDFKELQHALRLRPALDVGCGDGDLTLFLWYLGCKVTAIDHPRFNFNGMRGVRALANRMQAAVRVLEIDLDSETTLQLPDDDYGLVLLLGVLYHLKNPFYALERLSRRARFCMLSTRIAARTPAGSAMQGEALAYLLDSRETNQDDTNYWIFSEAGLLRILKRASWEVRAYCKLGCAVDSDPVSPAGDERMFLILRSKLRSAPALVRLQQGWCSQEGNDWCWVEKDFSIEVTLLEADGAPEFELAFVIIDPGSGDVYVSMQCKANEVQLPVQAWRTAGNQVYRTTLPATIDRKKSILLSFSVRHDIRYGNDPRNLGVVIPCRGDVVGTNSPVHFWIA